MNCSTNLLGASWGAVMLVMPAVLKSLSPNPYGLVAAVTLVNEALLSAWVLSCFVAVTAYIHHLLVSDSHNLPQTYSTPLAPNIETEIF